MIMYQGYGGQPIYYHWPTFPSHQHMTTHQHDSSHTHNYHPHAHFGYFYPWNLYTERSWMY
ncbi:MULTISPECIES: hypothetical protein [Bacillus]|uniref:hypothetical protein n=1 Tax=Bacillus TaxID=1386 RepID=UPI000BB87187|nr:MULTISPECIES: hypothetical protein [Bacillus]